MGSLIEDKAMIELLSNLPPPLTAKKIKDVLPDFSSNKDKDIKDVLTQLSSINKMALLSLFKSIVLEKRGTFKSEMKKKTESYFQDEVSLDAYKTDATIGKGKTVLHIDILGRKENNDICVFITKNLDNEFFDRLIKAFNGEYNIDDDKINKQFKSAFSTREKNFQERKRFFMMPIEG